MAGFSRRRYLLDGYRRWLGANRSRVRGWLLWSLGIWLVVVVVAVWFSEPLYRLEASVLWVAATVFDMVGLSDWTWTVETEDGDAAWQSDFIRYSDWHQAQVDAVVESLLFGVRLATGLALGILVLLLAWWLGKKQGSGHGPHPVTPGFAPGYGAAPSPALPVSAVVQQGSGETSFPTVRETSQVDDQEREGPDIHDLFREGRFLSFRQKRCPVAKHRWDYRPS